MEVSAQNLPRLTYIGDVPVEASYHGSALLFRLLQAYPAEKLLIVEGNLHNSLTERRLVRVPYRSFRIGWGRLTYTRFSVWATLAYSLAASWRVAALGKILDDFRPEAVLAVGHECMWITAMRYARRRSVPAHFIIHDDWPKVARFPRVFRPWLEHQFGRAYRQAHSCLCVSPFMEETYRARYGRAGAVLYPSRARDCLKFERPPERLRSPPLRFTVVFAGNIPTKGYMSALQNVAESLLTLDGRLLIYGTHTQKELQAAGLSTPNIEACGLVSSEELIRRCRADADVLFVPMSFDASDEDNMRISFPSKLTDSTIPGLPLLIYGPDYCSAVRWARENSGVAEVVSEQKLCMLSAALGKLREPAYRWRMGDAARLTGEKFFSHGTAERTLHTALAGNGCSYS